MKSFRVLLLLLMFLAGAWTLSADTPDQTGHKVLRLNISSAITPAQEELLGKAADMAAAQDFINLLVILDTPGGLAESMRNMVKIMLNSQVPVTVWVAPAGARAASAGVFLVAASDLAAMSPQSTIGSASPVDISGKQQEETMSRKIINDMVSLIRSVAQEKGRNVDWYESAVTESANLDARAALQERVIDIIAESEYDLLAQMGKRGIRDQKGDTLTFSPDQVDVVEYEPGFKYKILSWLLHPQIAYLLFLAGMAGLFFEFSNPGAVFPGVVGAVCLIVGLYSLSVLPTNVTGILLLILGFIFIIIEINIPTFGLLTMAALVSFFLGSIFLFDAGYPFFKLPAMTIIPVITILTAVLLILAYLIGRSQLKPKSSDTGISSDTARVLTWNGKEGKVKVRGEIWNARTEQDDVRIEPGQEVSIVSIEGMTINIKP